jgi:hypothetical protein
MATRRVTLRLDAKVVKLPPENVDRNFTARLAAKVVRCLLGSLKKVPSAPARLAVRADKAPQITRTKINYTKMNIEY